MAHYIRFEILLPVEYTERRTGQRRSISRHEIAEFANQFRARYGGYTESNPIGHPPYRGFWEDDGQVEVDQLNLLMVLYSARA